MANSFSVSTKVQKDAHHAWEYYFNQINSWWPREFFTSAKTKRFIIDTYIGGRAYEDFGEGGGVVWGDVIGVDYPHVLQLRGNLSKEFGGPVITFEKFEFKSAGSDTEVIYSVDFVGDISDSSLKSLREGWEDLLNNRFKSYCQSR